MSALPNSLRYWRRHQRLTQKRLAELYTLETGKPLTYKQVSNYEHNICDIPLCRVRGLARVLGITLDQFVYGEEVRRVS